MLRSPNSTRSPRVQNSRAGDSARRCTSEAISKLSTQCEQPFSFPRRAFCARVLLFRFTHPIEGVVGAPRVVRVLARHPLGLHVTRQARRLARRLASLGGRSPPGAPPWRFLAPVPRFPSPAFAPERSQRAPRTGS